MFWLANEALPHLCLPWLRILRSTDESTHHPGVWTPSVPLRSPIGAGLRRAFFSEDKIEIKDSLEVSFTYLKYIFANAL
jgi:hypothetical protein